MSENTLTLLDKGTTKTKYPRTQMGMTWYMFRRHKMAMVSLFVLILLFLVAIFAKQIMPYDPVKLDPAYAKGRPQPPTAEHWFGTDDLGRDLFSRAISGARISLSVGFVSVGVSLLIGIVLGSLAGFFGGVTDNIIMRIADIFLSLPTFYLIISVNSILKPSIFNVMVVIGVFGWMGVSRLLRSEFLRLKSTDFITAAQAVGVPGFRMVLKHLIPNAIAPVIVNATMGIPSAILLESSLSFLGLGVPPPAASWGSMLQDAKTWLHFAWWMWVIPGLLISITVIAFNFVGDGLRDALDPIERGRG
jgi:peptide/nickel transport system permease protein